MTKLNTWYIKTEKGVIGPFPAGQVSQMVLLGRLGLDSGVSQDKEKWFQLGKIDALIPDVYKSAEGDEISKERIEAAKRWADERRDERRKTAGDDRRVTNGRRITESDEERAYRERREQTYRKLSQRKKIPVAHVSIFTLLIIIAIYFSFIYSPDTTDGVVDCRLPAQPAVNWKNCNKTGLVSLKQNFQKSIFTSTNLSGANLVGSDLNKVDARYADLSRSNLGYVTLNNARLKGANFKGADLSNASFKNADLKYANLENTNITNTSFKNADLSFAIWTDGRTCKAGSLSQCK